MKPNAGLSVILAFAFLQVAACTTTTSEIPCDPVCPASSTCDTTQGICVPNDVDAGAGVMPDLAMATCTPACSGALPYCDANHRCAACLIDSQCPAGNVCKSQVCVPGCTDDARCKGANPNSPQVCCGGQCTDASTDPHNCGGCGMACSANHANATCAGGKCAAGSCSVGWGDCNNDPMDGCETALHVDPANCGMCGTKCVRANAIAGCSDACYIRACNFGYDDCDNNDANGCETSVLSDVKNCGACGTACMGKPHSKASCVNAACQITACDQGYTDCDANPANGCEISTFTDANNCGKCGNVCGGNLVCVNGGCTCPMCNIPNSKTKCVNNQCTWDSCIAGFGDCDNNVGNGCEVNLNTDPKNCSACGMACPQNTPFCFNGACQAKLPGVLLGTINGQEFYKVQVMGPMSDTNIAAACTMSGFRVPCQGPQGCMYNDNVCAPSMEKSCGNPMQTLAQTICNGANPPQCPALSNCFQYMGHKWVNDSACGTQNGQWCIQGNQVQNQFAICVQ